jgi:hypothetical protein
MYVPPIGVTTGVFIFSGTGLLQEITSMLKITKTKINILLRIAKSSLNYVS